MIQYLTARQIVNSGLLGLDILLLIFIVIRLYRGGDYFRDRATHAQMIIAMGLHIVGLMIVRGWTAILTTFMGHKDVLMTMEDQYPFDLIGATIALVGMMWMIKIFSPPQWGNHGWIVSLAALIAFVSGMLVIS